MAGRARSSSCWRRSARSPTRPPTAATPRTHSTWCCRPCPGTASRASRPSSAGTPAASHARGRSAWAELMDRLDYTRYVAQGGDVGAAVTDAMGRQEPEGLLGIHLNVLLAAVTLQDQLPAESEQERAAHDALTTFLTDGL